MAPCLSHRWTTDPEYIDLLNFIIERSENVESPMNIQSLVREFKVKSEKSQTLICVKKRIGRLRANIHNLIEVDTNTKVKLMFTLSASVDADFLEELKKDALVEVDEKQRIAHYNANDGSFELRGDHSPSPKNRTSQFESKRTLRSWIIDYFENKNNADTVSKNEGMRETGKLIEFITEKCENINSSLNISRLAEDFMQHFGISVPLMTICYRVKVYCRVIQTLEFLDTPSKIKQLFGLSATLGSDFLKELRKDAFVEVDHKNRIIEYMSNDNSLTLRGSHYGSGNTKSRRVRKKTLKGVVNMSGYEGLDDGSDECSSEEFDSEFDSDEETEHFDTQLRRGSLFEMSIEDDFEYDPPSPATPKSTKRKTGTTGSSSSKRVRPSSDDSMRPNELDDYDPNDSIEDQVKLKPFRGSIQENLNEIEEDEDFQQVLKPLQAHDDHNQIEEVPIKIEVEEPVETKPETSHNSKIKFFKAMQSLIICLDTLSLSWIQTKINQKIQTIEGQDEMILNNEIVLIIELLIARMTNYSVVNLSKNVESVNLSSFLCYLKAAIQISKISGLEDLVKNISKLIGETHNKNIPTEKVANALCTTLYIDGY
ncbi:unnamed protein product [Caenorhabditis brenneri]